jgi:NhaP-type Na+/H+ or K+/H+ antiporter
VAFDLLTFGLLIVGSIVLVALISELLARITRVPNIVFHLLLAIVLTPFVILFGFPFIDQHMLKLIIGLFLALIVFEGGYNFNRCLSKPYTQSPKNHQKDCKPHPFRHLLTRILRLSVIAGIITSILMTFFFIFFVGFPPFLAALSGSLCAITGPTVINPILRELNIKEEVAETLKGEGELNDAIFAVAAGAIFTAFLIEASGLITNLFLIVYLILLDLGIGILVGIVIGGVGILLSKNFRPWVSQRYGKRFDHTVIVTMDMLALLSAAILAFGFGSLFGVESSIAAALVAGMFLGQRHRFERHSHDPRSQEAQAEAEELTEAEIHTFQLPLTHIAVATIFIFSIAFSLPLLASIVFQWYLVLFALTLACLLMFVVRPIAIFAATIGTSFSYREKLFMSFLAPRGVIISALALFFALEFALQPLGDPTLAATFLWFILAIVFVTIIVEGGLASWTARKTGVIESTSDGDPTES